MRAPGWLCGIVLGLLFVVPLLAACSAVDYTNIAMHHNKERRYKDAIEAAKQATAMDPAHAPAWYWLGAAYYNDKQWDEAIRAFNKVVDLKPQGVQLGSAYYYLGFAHAEKKQYRQAIRAFRRAFEADPELADGDVSAAHTFLGFAHNELREYDQAIPVLKRAIELDAKSCDARHNLASAYLMTAQHWQVVEAVSRAIEQGCKEDIFWTWLSQILYAEEADPGTVLAATKKSSVSPYYPAVTVVRGLALIRRGTYDEALKELQAVQEAVKGGEHEGWLTVAIAYAHLGLGDRENAIGTVRKMKELAPEWDATWDLARIHYVLGEREEARSLVGARGWAGMRVREAGEKGAEVVSTVPNSPAHEGGILAGDVVVQLNEVSVANHVELVREVRALAPGTYVRMRVVRGGTERQLGVRLGSAYTALESDPLVASFSRRMPKPVEVAKPVPGTPPSPSAPRPTAFYADSWAVIVGINDYQHRRVPKLRYAVNDARAIERALVAQGFRRDRIVTLIDSEATKARIETVLGDELRQKVGPNDRALVFFAGHGMTDQLRSGEEEGYLIPVDGDPGRLFGSAISMTALRQISERLPAKHILYVVDACYSGYAFFNRTIGRELMEEMLKKPAIQILTAGRKEDQAQERGGHGVFTEVLVRGLQGEAFSEKGWLALEELGLWVKERVFAESNKKQVPQYGNLSGEGQFVFQKP